jgi:hypothetical protein
MYVDQGISDRVLNFIRNILPNKEGYAGRIKITRIARGTNFAYFDYEIIVLADGTEFYPVEDIEGYYHGYAEFIRFDIMYTVVDYTLLIDYGRPTTLKTHKYNVEPNLMLTKTHKFNLEEIVMLTTTHKFNLE